MYEGQLPRRLCHNCRIDHFGRNPEPIPEEHTERDVQLRDVQYHLVPRITMNEAKAQYGLMSRDMSQIPKMRIPHLWNLGVPYVSLMREIGVLQEARIKFGGDAGLAQHRHIAGLTVPEAGERVKRDVLRSVFCGDSDQGDSDTSTYGRWFPGRDLAFVQEYLTDTGNSLNAYDLRAMHTHP
ncbi:hypothetical protein BGZ95_000990 [Linnemannia exigua]|uniref:Uncharacterized protein n=1 Tax=Linnemannia exigua TaxID=604196 RepID=A0AAD4D7G2_9FUNG|nr:hypothetical protein BGZ95_000990 [Linnemannia exigua]